MKPRLSLTDPSFRYVPSTQTDLRKTFRRVRRELEARARLVEQPGGAVSCVACRIEYVSAGDFAAHICRTIASVHDLAPARRRTGA